MMEAPFKANVSEAQRAKLHRRMNKLMLSDVVEKVSIKETIDSDQTTIVRDTYAKLRHYDVTVSFLNPSQYAEKSSVTTSQVRVLSRHSDGYWVVWKLNCRPCCNCCLCVTDDLSIAHCLLRVNRPRLPNFICHSFSQHQFK